MTNGTIGGLLRARAAARPDAPLLIDAATGEERSYGATLQQAARWAAFFAAEGLIAGDRVAVILSNRLEYAELYLGAALAGILLCPYNPALTDGEVMALVKRFGAKFVLAAPDRLAALTETLPGASVGPRGTLPRGLPAPAATLPAVAPDDPMVLVMTSGTSGGVKACRLSHANLCWTSAQTAAAFGLDSSSRYLTPLPLFHVNAQVVGLLAAIQAGGAVAIGSRLPAAKLWEAAARCRATGMSTVPALVHDLLEGAGQPPASLRAVVTSSAPLPPSLRDRFEARFGLPLLVCYGLSEAGCFVSYGQGEPRPPAGAVGTPRGCTVTIRDGEILVSGPGLFSGYDGDPEATRLALQEGWLHTGDCGHVDAGGFLHVEGRLKDMINRGGEKIAPDAVEAVLRDCPGVLEVAVFAVPDARLGEEVAAAIVPREDSDVSDEALWAYCEERLAEFETPKHWLRLAALPKGGTGKVLRRLLREGWERG